MPIKLNRRALALALGSLITTPSAWAQSKKRPSSLPAKLSSLPETSDAIKAFRAIESRASSGLNLAAYSKEVADLKVAVDGLDDALLARRDSATSAKLLAAFEPYQQAKEIWSACVASCGYGLIVLGAGIDPAVEDYAAGLLQSYPSMNGPTTTGGVFLEGGGRRIFYNRIVSALLSIGAERGKSLRQALLEA